MIFFRNRLVNQKTRFNFATRIEDGSTHNFRARALIGWVGPFIRQPMKLTINY